MPREHNISHIEMQMERESYRKDKHKLITEKMANMKRLKEQQLLTVRETEDCKTEEITRRYSNT
jgi:hypothetical protein